MVGILLKRQLGFYYIWIKPSQLAPFVHVLSSQSHYKRMNYDYLNGRVIEHFLPPKDAITIRHPILSQSASKYRNPLHP